MAAGASKGGNKGKPPKFSSAPARMPSGAPFVHSQPQQPLTGREIKLGAKYRGYSGW